MSTQTLIFLLTIILLMVIGSLVWLAAEGYLIGYILLAILGTVLLVGLGEILSLAREKIAAQRQQQVFLDNAAENMDIMRQLQTIQNQQNSTLMQQLSKVARLPQAKSNGHLLIEDGVFDELGD